jgi:hypothetical protein
VKQETELKYTVNTLVDLSRYLWGENSTEFLAGALQSVISEKQMVVLIDDLERQVRETAKSPARTDQELEDAWWQAIR